MHKMHKKRLGNQHLFDVSHECDIRDDSLLCSSTMPKLRSLTTVPTTTMSPMCKGHKQTISTMSVQSNPKEKKKTKEREDDNADGSDGAINKKKVTW